MGHGSIFSVDGHISVPFRDRQHAGIQRWTQSHGVLFPEHVQCHPVWLDPGGLPRANQGDCVRCCELLGKTVLHRVAAHRAAHLCHECEWRAVHGRVGGFHLHHCYSLDTHQVDGRSELLRACPLYGNLRITWRAEHLVILVPLSKAEYTLLPQNITYSS